jgi:hypothetical protein
MTKHNLFDLVWAIPIAAAVLLLAVDAHAQTIPEQFQGKWCGNGSQRLLEREPCDLPPKYKISAKGYNVEGYQCTTIKVRREPKGRWSIKFRCADKAVSNQIWWIDDEGSLIIRHVEDFCPENPLYESDCDFGIENLTWARTLHQRSNQWDSLRHAAIRSRLSQIEIQMVGATASADERTDPH